MSKIILIKLSILGLEASCCITGSAVKSEMHMW